MNRLLSLLRTSDGVFSVDRDQRIVGWSDSAFQILGYSAPEVLGRACYEIIRGRESCNFRFCRRDCPTVVNARRGRTTDNYDLLAKTRDGREIWLNISIVLLKEEEKDPFVVVHFFRDVTQRRQVEHAAAKRLRALRTLVAESVGGPSDGASLEIAPTPLPSLTNRELEVLRLLACGLSTNEIAENLVISPVTTRNHIARVLGKLGAKNRLQAVAYASNRQLI